MTQEQPERQDHRSPDELRQLHERALVKKFGGVHSETPPPPDATPAGDEWRGIYTCGDHENFMRLVLPPVPGGDAEARAVVEFGPSLDGAGPRGSFGVVGTFAPAIGRLHLEPTSWIHRPSAFSQAATFGLDGTRSADDRLTGTVLGPPSCQAFRAWHIHPDLAPDEPTGLFFKVSAKDYLPPNALSDEDCRRYGTWLASGRELHLGGFYVSSLFYDEAGQRSVLGRSAGRWRLDDSQRLMRIGSACQATLSHSATLADTELVRQIHGFVPHPLDQPKQNWLLANWGRAELAALLRRDAQERAATNLARLSALPADAASFRVIDQEAIGARSLVGDLRYLDDSDRKDYAEKIDAQRVSLGHAIVVAMTETFADIPATPDGLISMKATAQVTAQTLSRARAFEAATEANAAYVSAVAAKAAQAWPAFLETAIAKLKELDGADIDRFPEIIQLSHAETTLRSVRLPTDSSREATYRAAYDAAVDGMVQRSMPRLLAWVDSLPTSEAANRKLAAFTVDTFGSSAVPDRYPALREAVSDKLAAYNPEGYRRPDIVMSLRRSLWSEVSSDGLEDISYFATAIHQLDQLCPGTAPADGSPESAALMRYFLEASAHAVDLIEHGKMRNSTEAQRTLSLVMNGIFNQPGCYENGFGVVTRCVTSENQNQVQQAILTSQDAIVDMTKLQANGCDSKAVASYTRGSLDFAAHHGAKGHSLDLKDPWTAASSNP